jgi:3-hydroxy-3-methylglutaryl CoA synthase
LNTKEEFVLGGVATAFIVSETPKIIEYELEKKGTWTTDVYDTFRPSARDEVGNNEVSLYTYMDAIEGAYTDYLANIDETINFESYFRNVIYHTPFPGMSFQAHRTLSNITERKSKNEIRESFQERVFPSLRYARRVGSTYGASNFVGLCGLIGSDPDLKAGDRIGFFAYGSGAIGEFYSGIICPEIYEATSPDAIDSAFDQRREVSVDEYEAIEKIRESYIENPDVTPDFSLLDNWYQEHYEGKRYLVLKEIKNFYRTYEWS